VSHESIIRFLGNKNGNNISERGRNGNVTVPENFVIGIRIIEQLAVSAQ